MPRPRPRGWKGRLAPLLPRPRVVGGVVDRARFVPAPRKGADMAASSGWAHESRADGAAG